jgi:hypothetical protein
MARSCCFLHIASAAPDAAFAMLCISNKLLGIAGNRFQWQVM